MMNNPLAQELAHEKMVDGLSRVANAAIPNRRDGWNGAEIAPIRRWLGSKLMSLGGWIHGRSATIETAAQY
jgi:hypothetical protein